ncbi:MAG TPA: hypothetical protein VGF68_02635, partial [Solirubrobacteraceae bacterium]
MSPEDLIEVERAGRRCEMCQTGRRWKQFSVVRPEGRQPVVMCPACNARYGAEPPLRAGEAPVATTATAGSAGAASAAGGSATTGSAGAAQATSSPRASEQSGAEGSQTASNAAQPNGSNAAQPNGSGAPQPNGSGAAQPNGSGAAQQHGARGAKKGPARPARGGQAAAKERSAPREDRLRKALRELPHGEHSVARIAKAAGLNHEKTVRRLETLHAAGEVQQVGKRWSNEPPSTDI